MSIPEPDRLIPIQKQGYVVPMSFELAWADRFPQRAEVTEIPITEKRRADYKAFKKRWKRARKLWRDAQTVGAGAGWSTYGDGEEDAKLLPLEPLVEVKYLETRDEWIARVQHIVQHHAETGEWLEQPAETFFEQAFGHMYGPK